jgi:hypothetical protein
MTNEQKAVEIITAIAQKVADGESFTFSEDWGFGTMTVTRKDGSHTHVGHDFGDDDASLEALIGSMYDLFVNDAGLSWHKESQITNQEDER